MLNNNTSRACLQEAAAAIGYSAAALPLWEEFLLRYLPLKAQLQDFLPVREIGQHLAQLAQLYEDQSPLVANVYAIMATLSPESLPGVTSISDDGS